MIIGENYAEFEKLYLTCFPEDSKEDADFLFEEVFKSAHCIAKFEDEKPVAMLFLMDCNLNTKGGSLPFYYLYAAATHPNFRGRGIMANLLSQAKDFTNETGKEGIFLKPATKSLFDFYKKSDFSPFFEICEVNFKEEDFKEIAPARNVLTLKKEDYKVKRKEILSTLSDCYGDFSKKLFLGATKDCQILSYGGCYAVFEVWEGEITVKECLVPMENEEKLLPLLAYIFKEHSGDRMQVRFPKGTKLPHLPGGIIPEEKYFSVIWQKSTPENTKYQNPYHGFAFD